MKNDGRQNKIESITLKGRNTFWTIFSVKAFGSDLDFYFAENRNGNVQSKGVFCKTSNDSSIIIGEKS